MVLSVVDNIKHPLVWPLVEMPRRQHTERVRFTATEATLKECFFRYLLVSSFDSGVPWHALNTRQPFSLNQDLFIAHPLSK